MCGWWLPGFFPNGKNPDRHVIRTDKTVWIKQNQDKQNTETESDVPPARATQYTNI